MVGLQAMTLKTIKSSEGWCLTIVNVIITVAKVFCVVKALVSRLVCFVIELVDFWVAERIKVGVAAQAGSWMNILPISKDFIHEGVVEPEHWVKCCNCKFAH